MIEWRRKTAYPEKMNNDSKTCAILVAGGRGTRAKTSGPKQWQPLANQRVADWTVKAFTNHPAIKTVVVVHHADDTDEAKELAGEVIFAVGGATRALSVRAGLDAIAHLNPDFVLIHDMARPCVSTDLIDRCLASVAKTKACAPALPVSDALWKGQNGYVDHPVDRSGLFRAQTPQCFDYSLIVKAHETASADEADDVAVAQAAGHQVAIVEGEEDNLKITYPEDFLRAERILETRCR